MQLSQIGLICGVTSVVSSLQIPLRQPPPPGDQPKQGGNPFDQKFGTFVNELLDRFKVPSLAIAVTDGEVTHSAAYGTAVFPDTPATPETLYYTGSTTKSFVAAAFTILRDRSEKTSKPLKLTDPLHEYIDDFRLSNDYATLHTTLEDALSHRSGLPRHDLMYGGTNYTFQDLIAAIPHLPLTAEPRTTFQYCNIMFMLLSYIIETITQMSLGAFLKQNIWEPFGMHSTYLSLADAQQAEKEGKQLARGYYWNQDTKSFDPEPWLDEIIVSGAGNTISNVLDYAKYLSAMLNEKAPISKAGYQDLKTPRTIIGPIPLPRYKGYLLYTLGWETAVYHGHEVYFHDGGLNGFGALMLYIPSRNWAVTMMANTELRSNLIELIIQQKLLEDLLNVPHKDRFDLAPLLEIQLQLAEVQYLNSSHRLFPDRPDPKVPLSRPIEDYAGTYAHPAYRNLTLYLAPAHYPFASKEPVLTANRTGEITWATEMQFEHVSGEHFVVWSMPLPHAPAEVVKTAWEGEFRVAADGHVEAVGITFEELMSGEKLWFNRIY